MSIKNTIMIVLPSDNLGGAEQYLFNIAKYYSDKGYNIDVFFLYKEKSKKWREIQNANLYFTTTVSEIKGVLPMLSNVKKFAKTNYAYIFTSHQHINALVSLLRMIGFIKANRLVCRESTSIYLRYSGIKLLYHRIIYSFYRKNIDMIICQTPEMKYQLENGNSKFLKFNLKVIRNPVNLQYILERSMEPFFLELPNKFILAIGRLNEVKKFDKLIRAYNISKVIKSHKLLILGAGKEFDNLNKLIGELKLQDKVLLKGHVDNVYPIIKRASLGVISSEIEGFPNVLLQMYALNLKVVSTNCCGDLDNFPDLYLCKDNTEEEIAFLCDRAINDNLNVNFDDFIKKVDIDNFVKQIENYV